jgi:hypothetical protein
MNRELLLPVFSVMISVWSNLAAAPAEPLNTIHSQPCHSTQVTLP